jgi:hypothetical protein
MAAHLGRTVITESQLTQVCLAKGYLIAKKAVLSAGFTGEIEWQAHRRLDYLTETDLLRESAWVILSAGMKESVVHQKFPAISESFFWWQSARKIAESTETCCRLACCHFNHQKKIFAIAEVARRVSASGFESVREHITTNPMATLREFPFIGPVTVYHLAKNLGVAVAKPDRHLHRLASSFGYGDVQGFCRCISEQVGDSIQVVDIVLWRYATLHEDYLSNFRLGCEEAT